MAESVELMPSKTTVWTDQTLLKKLDFKSVVESYVSGNIVHSYLLDEDQPFTGTNLVSNVL